MKIAVRYFSRGGNTKKLADAIANAVGVTAETTDVPLTEDVDILFLGSSVYAYGVDIHGKVLRLSSLIGESYVSFYS
jgi:flavodoxin